MTRKALVRTAVAAFIAYVALLRPAQQHWGASRREVEADYPGDGVVHRPWMTATRAVTIDASPAEVWPWLVQMGGYTRAGWYSYDWIDNGGRPSAERIVPELQSLTVGDVMATAPNGEGFSVEAIDPPHCLVLTIRRSQMVISSVFVLIRVGWQRTRLVNRVRLQPRRGLAAFVLWLGMDTGETVMARRMLLGIKRRAERLRRVPDAVLEGGRVQRLGSTHALRGAPRV